MSYLIRLAIILAAIVLQMSLLPRIMIAGFYPELVLLVIVFLFVALPLNTMLGWVIVTGLLVDSLSSLPFGVATLTLISVSLLIHFLSQKVFEQTTRRNTLTMVLIGVISYLIFMDIWLYALNIISNQPYLIPQSYYFFQTVIGNTIYTLIASLILLPLFDRLKKTLAYHEERVELAA